MTKKELLVERIKELHLTYYGNEMSAWDAAKILKYKNAAWMEDNIAYLTNSIASKNEEKMIKEFFESENGKFMMEKANTWKEEMYTEFRNEVDGYGKTLADYLTEKTGIENIMINVSPSEWTGTRYTIGIAKDELNFIFGHSFEVYANKKIDWNKKEEKTEDTWYVGINFGTMGEFNPMTDTTYVNYLKLLSYVSSNTEFCNILLNTGKTLVNVSKNFHETMTPLSEWMKNPLKNEFPLV